MFACDQGHEDIVRSKYAVTLCGPPTMMLQPSATTFSTLEAGEKRFFPWQTTGGAELADDEVEQAFDDLRIWLAEQYETGERVRVGAGEIVRFSWGETDSPVHSEPDLTTDRVFMSVLYGSQNELRQMCEARGVEYGVYSEG